MRWTHHSLFIAIYRIEGLPQMDEYGSTDAFVEMKLPGQAAVKTKVVQNSINPHFNELLRLSIQMPMMYDGLIISVYDQDQGSYDDLIADTSFSLNKVVSEGEIQPHWIPLYGIKGSEGLQHIRQRLPHVALDTCYKGRLLVGMMAEESSGHLAPKAKSIGPCSDPPSEPYVIRFDLYQASQLDDRQVTDNSQIQVELQVGNCTLASSTGLADSGKVVWREMFEEKIVTLPSDLAQCPDIFINVNYTTTTSEVAERLGYIRLDLEDVVGFNHAPQWETLLRDPLYPKVAAVPGFLEYRLDFDKQAKLPKSERERLVTPLMRRFELRAHLYQARGLPAMDDDGLCNPYAVVTLQGYAGRTRVAAPTCDPQWYETVRLDLMLPQPTPISSKILVRVYDEEAGETVGGDQLVGKFEFALLGVDKLMPERPTWQPIWFDRKEDIRGEVLCSFQLIAHDELAKVPLDDITPKMHDVDIEVNVVGLREMLPYNNVPIGAPFLEIDCGDRSTADKVPHGVGVALGVTLGVALSRSLTPPSSSRSPSCWPGAAHARLVDAEWHRRQLSRDAHHLDAAPRGQTLLAITQRARLRLPRLRGEPAAGHRQMLHPARAVLRVDPGGAVRQQQPAARAGGAYPRRPLLEFRRRGRRSRHGVRGSAHHHPAQPARRQLLLPAAAHHRQPHHRAAQGEPHLVLARRPAARAAYPHATSRASDRTPWRAVARG